MSDLLQDLNPAQRQAAEHTDGPLLIVAGAGAGKTKTLIYRIANLIKSGVAPEAILAVTFTNKAAGEMRERVRALLAEEPALNGTPRPPARARRAGGEGTPFIATFHALGVRIIKENAALLNLPKHFAIFDRADSTRAIKRALEHADYDPKQFEPKRILSAISRAKGDGLTRAAYTERASDYFPHVVAEVWQWYERELRKEKALDFDDLLLETKRLLSENESVREHYRARWSHIHIDEYQDTNRVQDEIANLLTGEQKNICAVGDVDQCLVSGTKVTMADRSKKNIERVCTGDRILSGYGSGRMRSAEVRNRYKRVYTGDLISITTETGRKLVSTPEHIHFAGYRLGLVPQTFFTYLMYKKEYGYRLGVSQVYTNGQRRPMVGFQQRCNQEHADAVWIVNTHKTSADARVCEYTLSLSYGIPTLPFEARKGKRAGGYVHDQKILDRLFATFDTRTAAKRLLRDRGLSLVYPHHTPQAKKERLNIRITLCGDRRGVTPMHRVSVVSNNREYRRTLERLGLSVRTAKKDSSAWRFESAHKNYGEIRDIAHKIKCVLPTATIVETARLGTPRTTKTEYVSLPFLPAASVTPGMALFGEDGSYEIVRTVSRVRANSRFVYDLDVAYTHNFFANGIATHNSIYSWRGADAKNLLSFERRYPGMRTVTLEENYRSTKRIIAASNDLIARNKKRHEKNLFTNNFEGEKISLYAAATEADEARFVLERVRQLIESGVPRREIAILYRANFQSRILEEHFLLADVPYQVLGARFFERKEVKDVLSFIRLGLNPESVADLSRIANVPPRGVGKVTLLKMAEGRDAELKGKTAQHVATFRKLIEDIGRQAHTMLPSELIAFVMKRSGLEAHLNTDRDEDRERLENIRELVTLAKKYDARGAPEGTEALLESAALASDQDALANNEDAVKMMTVHAAKGLEFDYVFVTGMEEGLFPHARADTDRVSDDEEERRLFYVALTRACVHVTLSFASVRTIFGTQTLNTPSSFLEELGEEHLEATIDEHGYEEPTKTVYLE